MLCYPAVQYNRRLQTPRKIQTSKRMATFSVIKKSFRPLKKTGHELVRNYEITNYEITKLQITKRQNPEISIFNGSVLKRCPLCDGQASDEVIPFEERPTVRRASE